MTMSKLMNNKLTEAEIRKYILPANTYSGIDEITESDLRAIDLDNVQEVELSFDVIKNLEGRILYRRGDFVPKAGSIYLKPSFAGRQVIMGRTGRELHFSNGIWFM